jgi:hypothetical protein
MEGVAQHLDDGVKRRILKNRAGRRFEPSMPFVRVAELLQQTRLADARFAIIVTT